MSKGTTEPVSTHSRPKAAGSGLIIPLYVLLWFQLTAARRRLVGRRLRLYTKIAFQLTAARRRLGAAARGVPPYIQVSTHSRPKAAGPLYPMLAIPLQCFNSQPPEGGWLMYAAATVKAKSFNSQPPEGGWFLTASMRFAFCWFQLTAARRRLDVT